MSNQGGGEAGVSKKTAHNVNKNLKTQLDQGFRLGHPYLHDIKNCSLLSDSVYLTPNSKNSYDLFMITCLQEIGNFTHPDIVQLIEIKGHAGSG